MGSTFRSSLCALHFAICTCVVGCSPLPALSVRPQGDSATLQQAFDRAYVNGPSDLGEDQVVLVNVPLARRTPDGPTKVIEPLAGPVLHTVVWVRLHWRAVERTVQTRSGLNGVLHWYAYGSPAGGGPPSLLHYVGAGFVTVERTGDGADVTIQHGSLSLVDRFGELRDPLGTFTLQGSFHATTAEAQVGQTLADVKRAQADAARAYGKAATRP